MLFSCRQQTEPSDNPPPMDEKEQYGLNYGNTGDSDHKAPFQRLVAGQAHGEIHCSGASKRGQPEQSGFWYAPAAQSGAAFIDQGSDKGYQTCLLYTSDAADEL